MTTEKGKLVRWFDDKGFGFIKQDNGKEDLFIHISALKGMSRKPIIGDVIHYQTSFDARGKACAANARIEGVSQTLTIAPLAQKITQDRPLVKDRSYRNPSKRIGKPQRSRYDGLFTILVVIGVAVFIYKKVPTKKFDTTPVEAVAMEPMEHFQCQGKVWCSEMTSYEEAIFYLRNCPGTKMDGDGDGIPCENQF
ncbi:cold shock domain-containing protein [Methylomicrobium sp. RS1]|uniref:cold shock domain-containing protein n=1 Tax=Candidatus Methylomicrobium oryzae TaxID=2802053 RepID=UPI0019221874|nr:cold shock domain-containing protein [Methylomicrobium sp. RS1]MBL1265818.1 cold shock domain-containing protein [Methylomicrobium sp. RS1]